MVTSGPDLTRDLIRSNYVCWSWLGMAQNGFKLLTNGWPTKSVLGNFKSLQSRFGVRNLLRFGTTLHPLSLLLRLMDFPSVVKWVSIIRAWACTRCNIINAVEEDVRKQHFPLFFVTPWCPAFHGFQCHAVALQVVFLQKHTKRERKRERRDWQFN